MSNPNFEEVQLQRILLSLFDKGLGPEEVSQNVNESFCEILNIRKSQQWFRQFKRRPKS